MATAGTTASGAPDMVLIGELLEDISRNPPAIGARKLLVEHYIAVGWLDAALDNAKDLKSLAPGDSDITKFLQLLEKKPEPPKADSKPTSAISVAPAETRVWDSKTARYKNKITLNPALQKVESPIPGLSGDLSGARKELTAGYSAVRAKARYVLADLRRLQALQKKAGFPQSKSTPRIQALVEGRNGASNIRTGPPGSARSVARNIRDNSADATNLAITDFESSIAWIRESCDEPAGVTSETIRSALVKRKSALEAALPEELRSHCELALMHVEHENECLDRNYVNTETMLMEEIKDIPRTHFYVTEDNYAWDMSELVQAIEANSGIFRNPLSKEMFTTKDVKGILTHPLGKPLSALAVEQHEMAKGVRITTIEQMEKLSKILLEDQSSDTIPSRKAVDEFLAYIATLPALEQKVIDGLKCPAKDSHTGQSYDFSIGESVRDAKGNRVCFHKTGDFIRQAAGHLRQNQGVAPESGKCAMM